MSPPQIGNDNDVCKVTRGAHDLDWSTVQVSLTTGRVLHVHCRSCGDEGTIYLEADNVDWRTRGTYQSLKVPR